MSDVTIWEIAIRRSTGKLEVPDDLPEIVGALGFSRVPLERRQAWAVRSMPRHHGDPFDRLLLAQATDLGIPLVSADEAFGPYKADVRW